MSSAILLRRFVSAQDSEVVPVLYSFLTLFCLLASYFVVVPLREEAGIALGTDTLPKLFTCTLIGTVMASPLTSAFLSRQGVSREASLRQFYAVLATAMLGFYVLYYISTVQAQATLRMFSTAVYSVASEEGSNPLHSQGLVEGQQASALRRLLDVAPKGVTAVQLPKLQLLTSFPPPPEPSASSAVHHGDPTLDGFQRAVRAAFYIFLNVQNLVAISAIWARCADVFSAEAASRLFGFISAGATVGQLLGSLVTATVAKLAGRDGGPVYGLIFFSAMLMYGAAFFSSRVQRPGVDRGGRKALDTLDVPARLPASVGGTTGELDRGAPSTKARLMQLTQSFTLIFKSPYLLMLCTYLMMTYVVGSLMYFQRSLVVATVVKDANSRTAFFATVHSASAFVIIILQMFATGRMLKLVGITVALASFPVACALLIAGIGIQPSTTAVALGEVVRKLLGYSLVRPAREVLFTVVSREEKYKAKLTIDAVVQRLGDTVAAFVFEVLDVQLHMGQAGVAIAGVAACSLWSVFALRLGARQKALASHAAAAADSGEVASGGAKKNVEGSTV